MIEATFGSIFPLYYFDNFISSIIIDVVFNSFI